MKNKFLPSNNEIKRWMYETVRHSCHVEYYLNNLDLGKSDPERPHDLSGEMNKFDWDVMKGLALAYRRDEALKENVMESVELHRGQYHHQMWNYGTSEATEDDLFVGVVDTVCSMLEKRVYSGEDEKHGRKKSWAIIEDVLYNKSLEQNTEAAKIILPKIRELERPKLNKIKSIYDFPNIGIGDYIYRKINNKVYETLIILKNKGYEFDEPKVINRMRLG